MESASEVQHLTAGIGRIVETGWMGMKRVEILERRKRPTAAEIIIKNGLGPPIISSINKSQLWLIYRSYGSKKKEENSGGQNIEKGVQTLTMVTRELMISFLLLLTPLFGN